MSLITLISREGKTHTVSKHVFDMAKTIKDMLVDMDGDISEPISLDIDSSTLDRVIEWCTYHRDRPESELIMEPTYKPIQISEWDIAFCDIPQATLFEVILAANYLNIKPLIMLTCKTVADMIKGKTPTQIRELFNIENDFTPEEEEQIRNENAWCN